MSYCKLTHDFCSPEVCCAGVTEQAKDRSGSWVPRDWVSCWDLYGMRVAERWLGSQGTTRSVQLISSHPMGVWWSRCPYPKLRCRLLAREVSCVPPGCVSLQSKGGVWNRLLELSCSPHWQQEWQKISGIDVCISWSWVRWIPPSPNKTAQYNRQYCLGCEEIFG